MILRGSPAQCLPGSVILSLLLQMITPLCLRTTVIFKVVLGMEYGATYMLLSHNAGLLKSFELRANLN